MGGVQRTKPALSCLVALLFFRIYKRGLYAAKQKSHGVNPGFDLCRVDWIRTSDLLHPMEYSEFIQTYVNQVSPN
jgi:hypothetical protein